MECEGKTWSPLGPRPEGLGGWTKSESGIDLGAHEIGMSGIVNSNISPKVQQVQDGPLNTGEHKVGIHRDKSMRSPAGNSGAKVKEGNHN